MVPREKIIAVQKMQDHILAHITEPITLGDLARAAGYSPYYAARIFKTVTGKAPFDYIRTLRLSMAAEKLNSGGIKVIDVAFDFLFGSHEGFTRAFSKEFGIAPKNCAKSTKIKLFIPPRANDYYLRLHEGDSDMSGKTNTVFVQVVERPKRKVILKRGIKAADYYAYCEEVGCDVWDVLSGIKDALYEPIGMWLPDNMIKAGTSKYAQGVEMAEGYNGRIPEGYEILELPPCKMMVFQGQPFKDEEYEDAIGDIWEVMKNYDPKIYGFEWADNDAPRFQLAPLGYRGYIEARPVRELNK